MYGGGLDSRLRRDDELPVAPAQAGAQDVVVCGGFLASRLRGNDEAAVAPAQAGAQEVMVCRDLLDSRLRGNDDSKDFWIPAFVGMTVPRTVTYQLRETYSTRLQWLRPAKPIATLWIRFDVDGTLTITAGYAWDGPSGWTLDTTDSMRASLVHDALYQLLREQHLPPEARKLADQEFHRIGVEDGMWRLRIRLWLLAVRFGAGPAADPASVAPDRLAGCGCSKATG